MHERTPRHTHAEMEGQQLWPIRAVGERLGATPQPAEDAELGAGHLLRLGEEGQITLELYPATGVVRLFGPDTYLELTSQQPPHIRRAGVLFVGSSPQLPEAEGRRLIVTESGEVLLSLTRPLTSDAAESPTKQVTSPGNPELPPDIDRVLARASAAPQTPSTEPPDAAKTERERLSLVGRVGHNPRLRTTPNGTLIATFPLAVRDTEDNTTWHTIVAFDKRAEQVRDNLTKGQQVAIIGYSHERDQKRKDGTTRKVTEVYAAVVKTSR